MFPRILAALAISVVTLQGQTELPAYRRAGLPIDARRYDAAACMLRALGVHRIRLLTNNPLKMAALAEFGIEVAEREASLTEPGPENEKYLRTKAESMGHHDLGHLFE